MPGNIWRIALIFPFFIATVATCGAAESKSSLARRLSGDAADGCLDQFSLFEAALIAGGVESSADVAKSVEGFESRVQPALKKISLQPTGIERVRAVFDCLHRQLLHGDYRADYSEIHRTLADGHFNCVTATILFRYLCERSGVKSEVIAATSHVLCRVPEISNQLIETTCPECHSASDDPTWEHRSPHVQGDRMRVISDVQLIGKVFYNRGVAELEAKHYAQAVDLLVSARQFDREDEPAQDNLLATLNNWALAACDAGEYQTAARLISRGLSIDGSYPPFQSNDLHIHQQWVKSLCGQRRYATAIEVLNAVLSRHPDATPFVQGRLGVYGKWAEALFVEDKFSAAWAVLDQSKKRISATDSVGAKLSEIEFAAIVGASEELIQSGRTDQSHRLIREAIGRKPEHANALRQKLHLPQADF